MELWGQRLDQPRHSTYPFEWIWPIRLSCSGTAEGRETGCVWLIPHHAYWYISSLQAHLCAYVCNHRSARLGLHESQAHFFLEAEMLHHALLIEGSGGVFFDSWFLSTVPNTTLAEIVWSLNWSLKRGECFFLMLKPSNINLQCCYFK